LKTLVESRKQLKRNHILDLIRRSPEPLSRFNIKKMTGYSMTTVSNTITELLQEQLLTEDTCSDASRMGRKPIFLHLNGSGGYFIGIEFNIQAIHYVILDFKCTPIFSGQATITEPISTSILLDLVFQYTEECLRYLGDRRERVLGIGIGLPGYIDTAAGIALSYPHMADWENIPIVSIMEKRFHLPCYIGNNVGVMGLVFKWISEYHQCCDFLLVSIRTGVRCIPLINQQPYFGKISSTGEIGHLKVSTSNRVCDCGQVGCLNTEVTDLSIRDKIEEGFKKNQFPLVRKIADGRRPTVQMLVRAAKKGDSDAINLIKESGYYLGRAIAQAGNLFAPQKIILSGQLIEAGSLLFDSLQEQVNKECLPAICTHMEIIPSPFGGEIGALGAAALVLENEFNPIASNTTL
jgi:xylose repressor